MERDIRALRARRFDVVVVGGGIHGACVARDAALRGLKVALVEQGDFSSATSHNSLKTVHGGIRYLQHLNFARAVASIREQQILLATLPHLVAPLPFLMPAYGWGMRGPLALAAGIGLYEALQWGVALRDGRRPRGLRGRVMSKAACLAAAPGVDPHGLTGGAVWADAQVAFADTAVLQILAQAAEHGAVVANYIRAEGLLFAENDRAGVAGIAARDLTSGEAIEIGGAMVVNAAGPWGPGWIGAPGASAEVGLVRSMNLVIDRPAPPTAFAVRSGRASDSRVDQAKRMFFAVPWQGKCIVGTTHFTHRDGDVGVTPDAGEIAAFLDEYNAADAAMGLVSEDVLYCYVGLTPGDDAAGADGAKLHESRVVDHEEADGTKGLLSIVGIKWTTARLTAEAAVDLVVAKAGGTARCRTRTVPVPDIPEMALDLAGASETALRRFAETHIARTQVRHLADILLRRSDDLVLGRLGAAAFRTILAAMAESLGWPPERQRREAEAVLDRLAPSRYQKTLKTEILGALV
ncbi:MAG: FAD-dependent oxidoreductase [Paracoccaceae bacterium]|nr:FAD-dependent oxidoreductase [Paracoccaceae bacterium]